MSCESEEARTESDESKIASPVTKLSEVKEKQGYFIFTFLLKCYSFKSIILLLGLFEEPVIREGKRERKKVERLSVDNIAPKPKASKQVQLMKGNGTPLGEIPYIAHMISKMNVDDMNILYRCLYDTPSLAGGVSSDKFYLFPFPVTFRYQ